MPPRPRPNLRPKPLQSSPSAHEAEPPEESLPSSKIPEPRVTSTEGEANDDTQEHYTYQEMIDHLRKARAGSQSVKSKKKRRRRSHQPIKQKRRKRLIITLSTLGVILPIASFTIGSFVFSYLHYKSESFRKEMSVAVSEALGLEAEFDDLFNVSKLSFKNPSFQANGPDDSILAELKMENLDAQLHLNSLFSNQWDVEHLLVDKTRLHLRPRRVLNTTAANSTAAESTPFKLAGLGFSGVPEKFNLSKITLHQADLFFGSDIDRLHSLERSHWILSNEGDGYEITGDSGTFRYGNWPQMQLVRASFFADKNGKFSIQDRAELTTESGGTCLITGNIITGGPEPSAVLNASVTGIKIDNMVPQPWPDQTSGLLSGQFAIVSSLLSDGEVTLTGEIAIPGLSLKNLSFLDELSVIFGTSRLKRLEFEEFTAKIERKDGSVTISDMYARQPDLMIFTGDITITADGNVRGDIEMGLPDSVINRYTKGTEVPLNLFELRNDAHNWVAISIGGTLAEPTEDLISRLYKTQGTPLPEREEESFQRPAPLENQPQDVYFRHLEGLFDELIK